ncbi:hypothetical protein FRB95_000384 [Tulasnella sp. JGI-2019a]|nr:hypothetical protein FRB95_000384 [Tulasnella sp. JGI-2019a]
MAQGHKATVFLVATVLSLILWALYVFLFIKTCSILRSKKVSPLSLPMVIISLIFLFNIGDIICVIFITKKSLDHFPDGAIAYYALYDMKRIDTRWMAIRNFCFASSAFAADILMTWRLFIIWSRDMRVIYLPIVLLTASGVNCIMVVFYDVFRISRFGDLSFSARYEMIIAAALAVDILLTWYLTGFICFRIWSVQQQNRAVAGIIPFDELSSRGDGYGQTRSRYENIMMSLMQSGMLYSINMAALLGCVLARDSSGRMESFGKDILNLLNSKVIGITSVLIMLQLDNGTSSCKIQQQVRSELPYSACQCSASFMPKMIPREQRSRFQER